MDDLVYQKYLTSLSNTLYTFNFLKSMVEPLKNADDFLKKIDTLGSSFHLYHKNKFLLSQLSSATFSDKKISELDANDMMSISKILLSFQQSGKSSRGVIFEHLISFILNQNNILHYRQSFKGIKSDFIIPLKEKFICLSVKTTLRERWAEIVKEISQPNVKCVYVFTLEDISPIKSLDIESTGLKIVRRFQDFIDNYKKETMMTCIDLFCGFGGFSSGFKNIKVIMGVDIDKFAIQSFKLNNPNVETICDDISNVKSDQLPECDIIVGGSPCVAYSMAGKRDSSDPRGKLFIEYCRILKDKKPKLFVFENVYGMLSMKNEEGGLIFNDILKSFDDANYNVKYEKYNCYDLGVPQMRKRVICVGIRKDIEYNFVFPERIVNTVNAYDLLQPREEITSFHSQKMIDGFLRRKEKNLSNGKGFGFQELKQTGPAYTISSRYYKDGSDCLVVYPEDKAMRKLTVLECLRIQSFPDDYKIAGSLVEQYKQIGNAVPYVLSELIEKSILNFFSNKIENKPNVEFGSLTMGLLKQYCRDNGVKGFSKFTTKDSLIAFLLTIQK